MRYDRDGSGFLEIEEFRDFLSDFNHGKLPTEQEESFMMKVADKDRDGKISLGELHYALRAWHTYCNLDDTLLRLFASFDADHSGRLDKEELGKMLTSMNGGTKVPESEVRYVMNRADVLGDGLINRSELLGAISAWYAHVDRKDTDIHTLLFETTLRTMKEHNHTQILGDGAQHLSVASTLVRGRNSDYAQVSQSQNVEAASRGVSVETWAQQEGLQVSSDGPDGKKNLAQRLEKASPFIVQSARAFCIVAFPFAFSGIMMKIGMDSSDNECPRNLDGLLVWFGALTFILVVLMYVDLEKHNVALNKARLAIAVILLVLNVVGLIWSYSSGVQDNRWKCGHGLVFWSMFVWIAIPIGTVTFGGYYGATHYRQVVRQEQMLGHDIVT